MSNIYQHTARNWSDPDISDVDRIIQNIKAQQEIIASSETKMAEMHRELDEALDVQKKEQLFEETPHVVYDNMIEDNALNFSIHNVTKVLPVDSTIGTRSYYDPMASLMYPKTAKVIGNDGNEYRVGGWVRGSYGLPMIERQEMQRLRSVYKRDK